MRFQLLRRHPPIFGQRMQVQLARDLTRRVPQQSLYGSQGRSERIMQSGIRVPEQMPRHVA